MTVGRVERFFLFLSATDIKCLEKSSAVEVHHQMAVGASILLSSAFAFASSYYVVQLVAPGLAIGVLLALLWAATIMVLNHLLVSSATPDPEARMEVALLKRYVALLLLRAPLAILVGFTIAIPLELKVFNVEIQEYLNGSKVDAIDRQAMEREQAGRRRYDSWRSEIDEELRGLKLRERQQRDAAHKTLDAIQEAEANPILRVIPLKDREGNPVLDADGRARTEHRSELQPGLAGLERKHHALEDELKQLRVEIEKREATLERIVAEFENDTRKTQLAQTEEVKGLSERRIGIATRYAALEQIRRQSDAFGILVRLVQSVFILIEVLPVLTKVFANVKQYELCLQARSAAT